MVRIRDVDLVRSPSQVEAPRLRLPRCTDAPPPAIQRLRELRQRRRRVASQIQFGGCRRQRCQRDRFLEGERPRAERRHQQGDLGTLRTRGGDQQPGIAQQPPLELDGITRRDRRTARRFGRDGCHFLAERLSRGRRHPCAGCEPPGRPRGLLGSVERVLHQARPADVGVTDEENDVRHAIPLVHPQRTVPATSAPRAIPTGIAHRSIARSRRSNSRANPPATPASWSRAAANAARATRTPSRCAASDVHSSPAAAHSAASCASKAPSR